MDVETALVGWQRERNCDDITHVKGAGERLAAALRAEQSARQAEKAERLVDHEKGAAFHARAIVAEGERHDLQQRIDALMECPQAIHGSFTRTPNGKCPWCEWEDLQQRIDATKDTYRHDPYCASVSYSGFAVAAACNCWQSALTIEGEESND
jgi:hypothetical protein